MAVQRTFCFYDALMRLTIPVFLLFLALDTSAQEADVLSDSDSGRPSLGLVALGAAAGYTVGAVAGYGVGQVADRNFVPENIFSEYAVAGIPIGGSFGSALGAHLANGRRGKLWAGVLASAVAQGLYILAITREPLDGRRFTLVLGIPLVGTGAAGQLSGGLPRSGAPSCSSTRPNPSSTCAVGGAHLEEPFHA